MKTQQDLPPGDRTETEEPKRGRERTTPIVIAACDESLRAKMIALRDNPDWSNNVIAKKSGVNSAYVSQYLDPRGCLLKAEYIARTERKFAQLLRNLDLKRASGVETCASEVSVMIEARLQYIRATGDVGQVIYGSGDGKTRAIELHMKDNENDVLLQATQWEKNTNAVVNMLFDAASKDGYDHQTPRMKWAVKKFSGTDRMILFDDAHKFTIPALLAIFEFNEKTGCPIALFGTEQLKEKIQLDAQMASRSGISSPLRATVDERLLKHHIGTFFPDLNGEAEAVYLLCEQIASHAGSVRAVQKTLKLAVRLKEDRAKFPTYDNAVRGAHTLLARDYKLQ